MSFRKIPFLLSAILLAIDVSGFQIIKCPSTRQTSSLITRVQAAATNGEENQHNEDSNNNILQSSSTRLSHVMLQVPSVDTTVSYWKETANGKVTASSNLDDENNDGDELRSAFVVLGNGRDDTDLKQDCFALELVKNKQKSFQLGNAIKYIGVSKLVQYTSKEDLIGMIMASRSNQKTTKDDDDTSSTTKEEEEEEELNEPNGIDIQSCASAPGDYFARLCLHTTNMEATTKFYADILGMNIAAIDEKMLCLRYDDSNKPQKKKNGNGNDKQQQTSSSSFGVPTTLVFEPLTTRSNNDDEQQQQELQQGNCFDHLVIATKANIDEVYDQIQQSLANEQNNDLNCPLFMKPTEMFGQKVFGVFDPNGYKIILAGGM